MMSTNTVIPIDSQQFITNLVTLRQHLKPTFTKLCLPIKSNAYGHGLQLMAQLAQPYVDYFGVACLAESLQLREIGITCPILIFGISSIAEYQQIIYHKLDITIASRIEAKQLAQYCQDNNVTCRVHLKVDTGMGRIGIDSMEFNQLFNYVTATTGLEIIGVYSHLANSDIPNDAVTIKQIQQFEMLIPVVKAYDKSIICHLSNSGGVCYYPNSYFDMVRPGILSYGYIPDKHVPNTLHTIAPCFSLKSTVVFIKSVAAATGISYQHKYITAQNTTIITIPLGYGDGYRRCLSNIGEVLLRGKKYLISGIICMDMLMIDVGSNCDVQLGDEVVFIGRQGANEITLKSLAQKYNTIIYEVLCGFTARITRVIQ